VIIMPKGDLFKFSCSITKLKESYDTGTLYSKTVVGGSVKRKTGIELIKAYFKYMIGLVTGESKKENDQLMEEMFSKCLKEYENITPSELHKAVKPFPLNPYDIKIANFVMNVFKENGKISDEKYKEISKAIERQRLQTLAKHLPEVVPTDFVILIEDPDWKEIVSLPETAHLKDKLDQENPELSIKELELMKKCLRLYNKIEKVKEVIKKLPSQDLLINFEELSCIEDVTKALYSRALHLHIDYKIMFGEVPIKEGELRPSSEQKLAALEWAKHDFRNLMENCTDDELKLQAAKVVQIIMCGSDKLKEIKPLKNGDWLAGF
jgi:hypothetical protein